MLLLRLLQLPDPQMTNPCRLIVPGKMLLQLPAKIRHRRIVTTILSLPNVQADKQYSGIVAQHGVHFPLQRRQHLLVAAALTISING